VRGVRANASRLSHAELDESTELDEGNPEELGAQIATLHADRPRINILGGCCGTDARHIAAIAKSYRNT
jgi:methionine synthase I (cobalamin-dependent)